MKQACRIVLGLSSLLGIVALHPPAACGEATAISPPKPGERGSAAAWVAPVFKEKPERHVSRIRVLLSRPEEEVKSCAAVAVFPYRMYGKNPDGSAKSVPLKVSLSPAAAEPTAADDEKAGAPIGDPLGDAKLTVHVEETSRADLDAFLEQLPAERREKVAAPLTLVSPALRFDIKHPVSAVCLELVVDPRPPTGARR